MADRADRASRTSIRGSLFSSRSLRSVQMHLITPMEAVAATFLGPSFEPESASIEELEDAILKLREANRMRQLENVALREYLQRRRPTEVRNVQEKYLEMMRRAQYLFRRPASQLSELVGPLGISQQSVMTVESETQSLSSYASSESLASVSALETRERLPLSERLTIVRITTQLARERLKRVHKMNDRRMRRMRYLTEVTEAQATDAEDTMAVHENLLQSAGRGHVTFEMLTYHVGKLLRDKDQALQVMTMERGRMIREANSLLDTLARRRELVKDLHPVDWDKLRYINEQHRRAIETKTAQWIAARKTVGYIGLDVHELQRKVARAKTKGKWVASAVESKMASALFVLNELPRVKKQTDVVGKQVEHKRALLDKYEPPPCFQYIEDCAALANAERNALYYRRNLPIRKVMLRNAYRRLVRLDKMNHEAKYGTGRGYEVPREIRELLRRPTKPMDMRDTLHISNMPSRAGEGRLAESPLGSWHSLSRSERGLLAAASVAACEVEMAAAATVAASSTTHWASAAAVSSLQKHGSLLEALDKGLSERAQSVEPPARPQKARAAPRKGPSQRRPSLHDSLVIRELPREVKGRTHKIAPSN